MLIAGNSNTTRVWYDGVGYQPVDRPTPTYTRLLGVDFNRDDVLGSPSQSLFRVVSGSAANQTANASSYAKTIGGKQLTISQPDAVKFEFRGANGDSTRAIPGGDTSMSYLVSDFIATRSGAIDLTITGLAAGNYLFRSYHLDTFTGSGPRLRAGNHHHHAQHDPGQDRRRGAGKRPAHGPGDRRSQHHLHQRQPDPDAFLRLHPRRRRPAHHRTARHESNGSDSFLLLNGFELFQANP